MITLNRVGRRTYLLGNTYPIKDRLRDAGAHWDGEKRAWWIGDHGKAEELAGAGKTSEDLRGGSDGRSDALSEDSKIAGKARYKGKGYLLVWEGETKRGRAAKLAFSDGSKIFWANAGEYEVTKRYEARERTYRGRTNYEHMTFGRLKSLRESYRDQRTEERKLGAKDGLVGERGEYVAQFDASKHDRKPNREIGDTCWLKHRGERIPVTVVGYELASYVRSEDLEDMGHYDVESGWYGALYYRTATTEEAAKLAPAESSAETAATASEAGVPTAADQVRVVDCGHVEAG